jgi:hypothetical protein
LTFPVWNPNQTNPNLRDSYIQGKEECTLLSSPPTTVACNFQNLSLTVTGLPATTSGVELVFSVTGFKNPIDTSLVTGFVLQTAIQTKTGTYIIDEGTSSLFVSDYATLQQGKLYVRDPTIKNAGTIQHLDTMILEFFLPVPLNKGCLVTVTLPKQYSVSTVQELYTMNGFGAYKARSVKLGTL